MHPVVFDQQNEPILDHPAPERLLSEHNPLRKTWPVFSAFNQQVNSGIWQCETGRWRIQFALHKMEFFCVIEGVIALRNPEGDILATFFAGQAGIIPPGFSGQFEVVSPVKKYYVIVTSGQTTV